MKNSLAPFFPPYAWQIAQLARHPQRPYFFDYVDLIFTDFQELHGDRVFW
ncbi:hypothetical protein BGP_5056 [Beggiatoa sp. PS]|nr:hypothetical protein BGP_5056 [Beggiatoa sp. PS]